MLFIIFRNKHTQKLVEFRHMATFEASGEEIVVASPVKLMARREIRVEGPSVTWRKAVFDQDFEVVTEEQLDEMQKAAG